MAREEISEAALIIAIILLFLAVPIASILLFFFEIINLSTAVLIVCFYVISITSVYLYVVSTRRERITGYRSIDDERYRYELKEELERLKDTIMSLRSFQSRILESQEEPKQEILKAISMLSNDFKQLKTEKGIGSVLYEKDIDVRPERVLAIYREVASEFAHTIKTPLVSIETAVKDLPEKLRRLLPHLQEEEEMKILFQMLENASLSLDYLRTILRKGAGFISADPEPIEIQSLLRKAIRVSRGATSSETDIDVSVEGVPQFKFYWLNLYIALVEIIENAFEAAAKKGKIAVTCVKDVGSDDIHIEISNTGHPIPEKIHKRILHEKFSDKGDGHGIGLSIAKRCLEKVGGRITLISKPNAKTTVFRISLSSQ